MSWNSGLSKRRILDPQSLQWLGTPGLSNHAGELLLPLKHFTYGKGFFLLGVLLS